MNSHPVSAPVASFDLESVISLDVAELQLRHPATRAPLPAFIQLAGPDHEIRRNLLHALMRERRQEFLSTGRAVPRDPAEDAADEVRVLVASTLGWRGLMRGGKVIEFSAGACAELYGDPRMAWVRDQVKAGADDAKLFLQTQA
jgi:hypothetical protein